MDYLLLAEAFSFRIERMNELGGMYASRLDDGLALLLPADTGSSGGLATVPELRMRTYYPLQTFSVEVSLLHTESTCSILSEAIPVTEDDVTDKGAAVDPNLSADPDLSADCRFGADEKLVGAEDPSAVEEAGTGEVPAPGPVLVEVVPGDLSDDGLLDAILECAQDTARQAARKMVLINELAHRRAGTAVTELLGRRAHGEYALSLGTRAVGDELALLLSVSQRQAEKQAFTAVGLCMEATYALDALAAGEIDLAKAEAILDYTQTLLNDTRALDPESDPQELAEAFQKKVLKKAGSQTLSNMRACANRALIKVDPAAAQRRFDRKRERRYLSLVPDSDSMCYLSVYLPADQGVRILTALKVLAEAAWSEGDARTLDQRSVDALVDVITNTLRAFDGEDVRHHCHHPHHHHTTPLHPDPADDQDDDQDDGDGEDDGEGDQDDGGSDGSDGVTLENDGAGAKNADCEAGADGGSTHAGSGPQNTTFQNTTEAEGATPTEHHDSPTGQRAGTATGQASTATSTSCCCCCRGFDPQFPEDPSGDPGQPARSPGSRGRSPGDPGDPGDLGDLGGPGGPGGPGGRGDSGPGATGKGKKGKGKGMRVKARKAAAARRGASDAQVSVIISADTLLGLSEDPGYLTGYGPIIASMARDIASTGTWRCAIANGVHGTLDGLGVSTYTPAYQPSEKLRRHLSLRDRRCRFPGCTRAAARCEWDHVIPYPEGVTCECNGEQLCVHHHHLKHGTGFRVQFSTDPADPPATLVWTTPAGRTYKDYPDPLLEVSAGITTGSSADSETSRSNGPRRAR